ncbi:MAG: hypothetical protein JW857_00105, partial [Bacteroidales bacterium]|nr:hypothetical protein [Bacteroidales bacterium]
MNKLFLKFLTQIFRVFHVKSLTIYQFTLILLIFTATLSVLLESGLWAYTETVRVHQNVKKLKEYTLNKQKVQLKEEVHRVIE